MKLYSTAEIAKLLGVSARRIRAIATRLQVGTVYGHARVYTEAELAYILSQRKK